MCIHMVEGLRILRGSPPRPGRLSAVYAIASTRTSTIPGISVAGPAPEATLLTPGLDAEYLLLGRAVSLNTIPVTPEGLPTPALLTRACLRLLRATPLVVDCGSYLEPRIPRAVLPSRAVGGSIDSEPALPRGASRGLFEETRALGSFLGGSSEIVLLGESMPGGTTTAMAVLRGLGRRAAVSSASRDNPLRLKEAIVSRALSRLRGDEDVFGLNDAVGDPLHISVAGLALGALEAGARVVLAGGTQVAAVLAILKRLGADLEGVSVITTRWVMGDRTADLEGMVAEIAPEAGLAYLDIDLSRSRHRGLRMYEEGFVKEGVGAGGTCGLAILAGHGAGRVLVEVEREYEAVTGGAQGLPA